MMCGDKKCMKLSCSTAFIDSRTANAFVLIPRVVKTQLSLMFEARKTTMLLDSDRKQ